MKFCLVGSSGVLVDMALLLVTLWNFWMNLWFNWRVDKTPARNAA